MVHEHSHASHADHSHSVAEEPAAPGSHQATVLATFDSYLRQSISSNQRRRRDFLRLSSLQRGLVPDYLSLLSQVSPQTRIFVASTKRSTQVDDALIRNAHFVHKIAESNAYPPPDDAALSAPAPTEADHDRLRSTLRQFSRDWSSGVSDCPIPVRSFIADDFNRANQSVMRRTDRSFKLSRLNTKASLRRTGESIIVRPLSILTCI